MEVNSTNNDGINEIKLNTNIKASQDTFVFLKGNVRFNLNSHTMTNTSSLFENYFLLFKGRIFRFRHSDDDWITNSNKPKNLVHSYR